MVGANTYPQFSSSRLWCNGLPASATGGWRPAASLCVQLRPREPLIRR